MPSSTPHWRPPDCRRQLLLPAVQSCWDNIRSEGDSSPLNPLDNGMVLGHGARRPTSMELATSRLPRTRWVACKFSGSLPVRPGPFRAEAASIPGFSCLPRRSDRARHATTLPTPPDFGTKGEWTPAATWLPAAGFCDNSLGRQAARRPRNPPYWYHEDDDGARYPACTATQAKLDSFNAAGYTLFKVNDLFLRQNDSALVQTKILPIDATNWDGNNGGTGKGATTTPSYVNVNTDKVITPDICRRRDRVGASKHADVPQLDRHQQLRRRGLRPCRQRRH